MYLNPSELMREMLVRWFKTAVDPRPSWEAVVAALRSPSVAEKNISDKLESKYCVSMQHMRKESSSFTKVKRSGGIIAWR